MDAIKLSVWVGENRKLVIELPAEIPVGLVEVQITPHAAMQAKSARDKGNKHERLWSETRERLRTLLRDAGMLSIAHHAPLDWTPLTEEERVKLGTLPPGARRTDEYVNEDRGAY